MHLLITVISTACICVGIIIYVAIICTTSTAESLNRSQILLTADRLSHRLVSFSDAVLHPQTLRDIYASVDYDVPKINADQVVKKISNTLCRPMLALAALPFYRNLASE